MADILLTGGSGFVGGHWLESSRFSSRTVTASLRNTSPDALDLKGVSTVIHAAGVAHRMNMPTGKIYYDINRDLSLELARQARASGVTQFVFLSSVKVYGSGCGRLQEGQAPQPVDDYGLSKYQAEIELTNLATRNFIVSIVRPPLVYGPRVKGNVLSMMNLLNAAPLVPLAGIRNERSVVYVLNLISLLECLIEKRAGGVFVAGDPAPLSTTAIASYLKEGMGAKTFFFAFPRWAQQALVAQFPRAGERLFADFVVSNEDSNRQLAFSPPYESSEGLIATGRWYSLSHGE